MAIAFPSGTATLFGSNTAPTGWTKVATYTDHALRVLGAGSPATGGQPGNPFAGSLGNPLTLAYTATCAAGTSGATTITSTTYVTHNHTHVQATGAPISSAPSTAPTVQVRGSPSPLTTIVANTGVGGTGGSHTHTTGPSTTFSGNVLPKTVLRYVDAIVATKN